jgi:hypothetical protein
MVPHLPHLTCFLVFHEYIEDSSLSEVQLAAQQIVNHGTRNAGCCRKVIPSQAAAACENANISSHFLIWILDVAFVLDTSLFLCRESSPSFSVRDEIVRSKLYPSDAKREMGNFDAQDLNSQLFATLLWRRI